MSLWSSQEWKTLEESASTVDKNHLRDLLLDENRCNDMCTFFDGILFDYSRQKMTLDIKDQLIALAEKAQLKEKISNMKNGELINKTENRAVMHAALRSNKDDTFKVEGKNVVPDVHDVLNKIFSFSEKVRSGVHSGATGKTLKNTVSIGIGGSYLGPEFVYEAMRTDEGCKKSSEGRSLRFLANVDPVDVSRALEGLDPEETLIVIVSKTFTTAETMLNARTLKRWLEDYASKNNINNQDMLSKHMIAVSSNVPSAEKFGINPENVFGFWDWVGGRYSVCSAVGIVPLALQYGEEPVRSFLQGAKQMDDHFFEAPISTNLPILLGLIGVWNSTFLKYSTRALLPYSQALLRFPAHIQQVDMESNGKGVSIDGEVLPFQTGEFNFGEPGTNGQHSFYQLIHQGRICPCDFIGSVKSQQPIDATKTHGEVVSNHDELMSNFFAQADALAMGKNKAQLKSEGVAEALLPHKEFTGNRPSTSILFPAFDPRRIGQLLALYEHRSAVQGFIWNINSFDQWGVELGKVLATNVRKQIEASKKSDAPVQNFNPSTTKLLNHYLASK